MHIEPVVRIKHTIIANNGHVGSGSIIEKAVLGDKAIIGYGQHVGSGRLVSPGAIVI